MMKKAGWGLGLAVLLGLPFLAPHHRSGTEAAVSPTAGELRAQESVPGQKPTYDYMSTYLSRNTKPLGLEEDREVRELRNQPAIKWAVRASWRHSLK